MSIRETRKRPRSQRAAFTLVELLITMTTGSSIMLLAIGLVHQAMSINSASRAHGDQDRSSNRLATEFRRDVHAAEKCTIASDQQIALTMPGGGEVTYDADANRVTRSESLGRKPQRRASFELFQEAIVSFGISDSPRRGMLTIRRPLPKQFGADQTRVVRQVAAVVGRRLWHQQTEASP